METVRALLLLFFGACILIGGFVTLVSLGSLTAVISLAFVLGGAIGVVLTDLAGGVFRLVGHADRRSLFFADQQDQKRAAEEAQRYHAEKQPRKPPPRPPQR